MKNKSLLIQLENTLGNKYPLYSQDGENDPMIYAKAFDQYSGATWYISEYCINKNILFCYVTGLYQDEWGYQSVDELNKLLIAGRYRVTLDVYFKPMKFSELKNNYIL